MKGASARDSMDRSALVKEVDLLREENAKLRELVIAQHSGHLVASTGR